MALPEAPEQPNSTAVDASLPYNDVLPLMIDLAAQSVAGMTSLRASSPGVAPGMLLSRYCGKDGSRGEP